MTHSETAAVFAVVLLLLATAAFTAEPAPNESLPIIDAHTHPEFGRAISGVNDTSRERFEREWATAGLVGAVGILHVQDGSTPDLGDHPMIYCAGVGDRPDLSGIETGLRTGAYGCVKVYLGYVHRYASDPVYEPVYRLAKKYSVPVVFHTGDTSSARAKLKYADPLTIDEVAVDHPDVNFVIAHCGNPWIESAAEVTYKNPNVYIECSAMIVGNVDEIRDEDVDRYMVEPIRWVFGYIENPDKMMFGSDWPLVDIGPYVEAYKRAIPREHWDAVFHDNAVRVFGFDESKRKPKRQSAGNGLGPAEEEDGLLVALPGTLENR